MVNISENVTAALTFSMPLRIVVTCFCVDGGVKKCQRVVVGTRRLKTSAEL